MRTIIFVIVHIQKDFLTTAELLLFFEVIFAVFIAFRPIHSPIFFSCTKNKTKVFHSIWAGPESFEWWEQFLSHFHWSWGGEISPGSSSPWQRAYIFFFLRLFFYFQTKFKFKPQSFFSWIRISSTTKRVLALPFIYTSTK